ncbi:MAG: GNAT family N-acetyltransferase; N-acetyltransferase [Cellvibrionales bacterium]
MRGAVFLTTDRLTLRPFEADDLKRVAAINADRKVMQFFPAPLTARETRQCRGSMGR